MAISGVLIMLTIKSHTTNCSSVTVCCIERSLRAPRFVLVLRFTLKFHSLFSCCSTFRLSLVFLCTLTTIQRIYSFLSIQFSQTQAIKHTIEKKMEEVYDIFNRELKMVNKELNQRTRYSDHMPHAVGQAHWARALRHRLDKAMEVNPLDYTLIYMYSFQYTPVTKESKVNNFPFLP